MMTKTSGCERVQVRLDRFLERDLEDVELARDEGHLEACASCAALRDERLQERERLRAALARTEDELDAAVALVHERLRERLAVRSAPPYRLRLVARRALIPALTAAAALLALALLQRGPTRTDPRALTPEELPHWSVAMPSGGGLLRALEGVRR